MADETTRASWWRDGVLYQIYPRSFADSDGDGIGDLRGILARLDHLAWLGVDGIWLNPTMPSPNDDWGYDVADYCGVHPDLGTLEDLDALVAARASAGSACCSTSSRTTRATATRGSWTRWAAATRGTATTTSGRTRRPDGGPPNNWESNFGGSAWQLHEPTGQYYLTTSCPSQPDLNWWNDEVREAFDDVLRFWFDARHRRLPHRRLPRDRQGPRAARRPARRRPRTTRRSASAGSSRCSR